MLGNRLVLFTCLGMFFFSCIESSSAYANYKRCWIKNGIASINCNPADGYDFIKDKHKDEYKKCIVENGYLTKNCKIEDGFATIKINNHWYQCPIQNGKKIDHCTLATGYYTIFLPHLPWL